MSEQRSQTWHRQSSHPWETKADVVTQHHPMGHRGHSHLCNNWSLKEGQKWQSVLNNATLSTWVLEKHITCQPRNWKEKEKKEYKRAVQTSQSSRQSGKGNKIYIFSFNLSTHNRMLPRKQSQFSHPWTEKRFTGQLWDGDLSKSRPLLSSTAQGIPQLKQRFFR